MKKTALVILLLLLLPSCAHAACSWVGDSQATAASASRADVADCLDDASWGDGDTINIPAGTETWASAITVANDNVSIVGAGKTSTIIIDPAFIFSPGTDGWRVTGIGFEPTTKIDTDSFAIQIGALSPQASTQCLNLRIDNCNFHGYKWAILGLNAPRGVVDNCDFEDGGIQLYGQDDEWASALDLGSSDWFFIEDNAFTPVNGQINSAVIGYAGTKYVLRYNTFTSTGAVNYMATAIDAHGYGHGADRSTRGWEIYQNTFVSVGSPTRGLDLRGGSGVVYSNTFNEIAAGYSVGEVVFWEFRQYGDPGYGPTGGVQGGCNTPTNAVSGLCTDLEGDPCCDAVGRGVDQAADPAYVWSNNKCTSAPCASNLTAIAATVNDGSTTLVEDTDFVNGAKSGYSAYTYPHPLRGTISGKFTPTLNNGRIGATPKSGGQSGLGIRVY